MEFINQKLSQEIVLKLLRNAEYSFNPPLSYNISYKMEDYALRLSNNASFILCKDHENIIGFVAYYVNIEGLFTYIPQIWVSDDYQRQGIGSAMIDEMVKLLPEEIKKIRLEVRKNNEKAYSFYVKSNYELIEDNNGKCVMEKKLVRY